MSVSKTIQESDYKQIELVQDESLPFSKQLLLISQASIAYFRSDAYVNMPDDQQAHAYSFFFNLINKIGSL